MKLKIYITCLVLLGLAGCGEHRDQVDSSIHELFSKASPSATISSIAGETGMTGQGTPRPATPPYVQPHNAGLVPVPSPSVGDVVALSPSGVGTIPATTQYKAIPGDAFDVIRSNNATISKLDNYFSPTK